ncbi:hypothetical protein Noda2021_05550 [Candidatus Dependentiae bacterium Noda2021]|nr:hypothetical protein Noda2021_05550 [Candidatus Dependentiae bacterium Noda2021]
MKYVIALCSLILINSYAMDNMSVELEEQEKLVKARMRWMGNEDLFSYAKLAMSIPGCTDYNITTKKNDELLAVVDMTTKVVTTYLTVPADNDKIITHSFTQLNDFLSDPQIKDEVAKCERLQKNLSILCSIQ